MRRALLLILSAPAVSAAVYLPVRRRSESWEQALRRTVAILGFSAGGYLLLRHFGPGRSNSSWDQSPDKERVDIDAYYEDVKLQSTDGFVLDARWVPQKGSSRAAVLVPGRGAAASPVPTPSRRPKPTSERASTC